MFCNQCGKQAVENAHFCRFCGYKFDIDDSPQEHPSRPQTISDKENLAPSFAKPTFDLHSLQEVSTEDIYAGFGLRLWATFLDGLGFIITLLVGVMFYTLFENHHSTAPNFFIALLQTLYVFWLIALLLYEPICLSRSWQATLGKRLAGIYVIGPKGKLSFWRSLGRHFAKWISAFPFYLGYLAILWHPKKQSWHDQMASTFVLKGRP